MTKTPEGQQTATEVLEAQLAAYDRHSREHCLFPVAAAKALTTLTAENARLKQRLEVVDGWSESADGISCRDDTIKLQDEYIARQDEVIERLRGRCGSAWAALTLGGHNSSETYFVQWYPIATAALKETDDAE